MKILIVEDEEVLAKVLQEKFEEDGFEVKTTDDGASSLSLAKSFKPDAILLDIILPRMGGIEVLAALKEDEELKNIPVIMLSNLDDDRDIKKSLSMGAVDYMVKTMHPMKEVVEEVKEYIEKAK